MLENKSISFITNLLSHGADWFALAIILLPILTGCSFGARDLSNAPVATLVVDLTDRSLLTDIPCVAPCWYGLELGKTTKVEALEIAKSLPFINPEEFPEFVHGFWSDLKSENVNADYVRLMCRKPDESICAVLIFVDGVLQRISLSPNYEITLQDVVDHFGSPDYVQVYPNQSTPLGRYCSVALIWKERRIRVDFRGSGETEQQVLCANVVDGRNINANLPIQEIFYALPGDGILATGDPWTGFAEP
jgi:hypothetical protein